MPELARPLHRLIRDPRVRVVVAVLLIVLAVALALHLVGMPDHTSMMLVVCFAVLAIAGMWLVRRLPGLLLPVTIRPVLPHPIVTASVPRTGRPPPEQGAILRP